jgi:hypothetical protein
VKSTRQTVYNKSAPVLIWVKAETPLPVRLSINKDHENDKNCAGLRKIREGTGQTSCLVVNQTNKP